MAPPFQFKGTSSTETSTGDLIDFVKREVGNDRFIDYLSNDLEQLEKHPPLNTMLPWLKIVEILEAEKTSPSTGRIRYRFPVQHEYLNPKQTLQGGLSAMMYDVATSWLLALIRKPGFWMTYGTSRTLNVTFLRPAVEGEMLLMDTEIIHAGKKLCLIKAALMREKDGAIISTCEHQKFNVDEEPAKL